LGEVYSTIQIQAIANLALFTTPHAIEKFIMEGCKRGDFHIRYFSFLFSFSNLKREYFNDFFITY